MKNIINNKIICIGDIILDEFINGSCERISPEAPVPVLNFKSSTFFLGGVANVAHNLKANKFVPIVFSKVSYDNASKKILELFKNKNINTNYLIRDKNYHLPHKIRFTNNRHHILRVDYEQYNSEDNEKILLKKLTNFLKKNKNLKYAIISDYGKGNLSNKIIPKIINILNKNFIKVVCDTKNSNLQIFKNSYILTPNKEEFNKILQKFEISKPQKKEIFKLLKRFKIKKLINTLGDKGCYLYDQEKNKVNQFFTNKSEVYDVTGAGDVFIANLVCSLQNKRDIKESIQHATDKATQSVKTFGISVPADKARVNFEEIFEWKRENNIIGFVNGCFDIIHPGHLKLLRFAKQMCDKLIVAINSDKSYKKIKNKTGPFLDQYSRKYNLEQFDFVDLVLIFDEKNPLKIIKKINPNLLFKGSDYKKKNVVGYKYMQSYGGKVIIFKKKDNFSSSKIFKKMLISI
jgi:D-beta-D-heptose 7-phosphate kinase/D-beta-D-heptose 1-phosphate adenosyltransferase